MPPTARLTPVAEVPPRRSQSSRHRQSPARRSPTSRRRTGARHNRGGDRRRPERQPPTAKIEDLLKERQEIVVQVVKEPLGTKGARITSHLSLPGRFLVYMPTVDHIGVSRKIESRDERRRLRTIVQRFREQSGLPGGVIIRTAASNRSEEDITADLTYFQQVWNEIQRKRETERTPAVLFREESLVTKLLRDFLTEQFTAIRIDDEIEYRRVMTLITRIMPNMAPRVKRYTKDYPIFDEYGVQGEIDKALRSKVWLKSGGYIVINQTEALVAIDVNTGRYVGKKSAGRLEDTIVKTNLEAVKEIVRQIRLRDLGGIIVLDFIDMEDKKNRQKVAQAVEQELRKDRAPSKAVQVSDFGLIIITRKRVKSSLERTLTEPCPYCSGTGTIKTSATICYDILTEVKKVSADLDGYSLVLRVNPGDRARAEGREPQRVQGTGDDRRPVRDGPVRRPAAPRAVRLDGDLEAGQRAKGNRVLPLPFALSMGLDWELEADYGAVSGSDGRCDCGGRGISGAGERNPAWRADRGTGAWAVSA